MLCGSETPPPRCCPSNVVGAGEYVTVELNRHADSQVVFLEDATIPTTTTVGFGIESSEDSRFSSSVEEWLRKEVCMHLSRIDQKVDFMLERDTGAILRTTSRPLGPRRSKTFPGSEEDPTRATFTIKEDSIMDSTSFPISPFSQGLSSPRSTPSGQLLNINSASTLRTSTDTRSKRGSKSSGGSCASYVSRRSLSNAVSEASSNKERVSIQETIHTIENIRRTVEARKSEREVQQKSWPSRIWMFTEKPFSSFPAYCYSVFVPVFVASGVCISFMQTVNGSPLQGTPGEFLQTVYEVAFALELTVRFIVCPDRREFMANIFNYIDLMSALPLLLRIPGYILEWSGKGGLPDDVLRGMSVVPLLRLLRLTRRFETFQLLLRAFSLALEALPVLLYILLLIALIFSALIYFVEPETNIGSLPTALWLAIVTMTTVGYGDKIPVTVSGHVVVSALIIISALYMAIPIGIVGHAFSQVWGDRDRLLLIQRIRDAFLEGGFNSSAVMDIFKLFDTDSSGELDIEEFELMLRTMQININNERVIALFNALDPESRGHITQEDLMSNLFPTNALFALKDEIPDVCIQAPQEDE